MKQSRPWIKGITYIAIFQNHKQSTPSVHIDIVTDFRSYEKEGLITRRYYEVVGSDRAG